MPLPSMPLSKVWIQMSSPWPTSTKCTSTQELAAKAPRAVEQLRPEDRARLTAPAVGIAPAARALIERADP
jgi:hypothetical protein